MYCRVQPLIYGGSLCGAGGGGFMVLIAKEANNTRNQIISLSEVYLPESQVYDCIIDEKGFELSVNDIQWQIPL